MPMIDVYVAAGTFGDPHALAQKLASDLMAIERVPDPVADSEVGSDRRNHVCAHLTLSLSRGSTTPHWGFGRSRPGRLSLSGRVLLPAPMNPRFHPPIPTRRTASRSSTQSVRLHVHDFLAALG